MVAPDESAVVFDEDLGFYRLNPLPSEATLSTYYRDEYYERDDSANGAPDVVRLGGDNDEAEAERRWRSQTGYADILTLVRDHGTGGGRCLDVGCGRGEFVEFAQTAGHFDAFGIEPSADAARRARSRGVDVRQSTIESAVDSWPDRFDLITLFNVLEHVRDPKALLHQLHQLAVDDGIVVIQVPNDYSTLQRAVQQHLGATPWWVSVPDHINYFDFDSLERFLSAHGFIPVDRYATFPMEFFLLAGLDYVSDQATGSDAHRRRCDFELGIDDELRRSLYRSLARAGVGRNAIVVARRVN